MDYEQERCDFDAMFESARLRFGPERAREIVEMYKVLRSLGLADDFDVFLDVVTAGIELEQSRAIRTRS